MAPVDELFCVHLEVTLAPPLPTEATDVLVAHIPRFLLIVLCIIIFVNCETKGIYIAQLEYGCASIYKA